MTIYSFGNFEPGIIDTTFSDYKKYKEAIKKVSLESEFVKEFGVYNNFKS